MTETSSRNNKRSGGHAKSARKPHRAAGSRSVAMALSATATAGFMIAMATAEPSWTADTEVYAAAESAPAVVTLRRPTILLPVPPSNDGTLPTMTEATPQLVQLDPEPVQVQTITRTVVVKGGSGTTVVKSSGSR